MFPSAPKTFTHYLSPKCTFTGTPACDNMADLLTEPALIKDIQRLSPSHQTSTLEAFHSLLIKFAPKSSTFMWLGQLARWVFLWY